MFSGRTNPKQKEVMMQERNVLRITEALAEYNPKVKFICTEHDLSVEFGGELPRRLVQCLVYYGAEVLLYRQRGLLTTVVRF